MAFIYGLEQTKPLALAMVHDPDEQLYYTIRYRAPNWSALAEKKKQNDIDNSGDVVKPTVATGYYAECISSGVTGSVEPAWISEEDAEVDDGTVKWKMHTDDFSLESGDVITDSEWSGDTGVTFDNDGIDGFDTYARVTAVPANVTSFIITNEVIVTRANGRVETINRSLKIKIKEK